MPTTEQTLVIGSGPAAAAVALALTAAGRPVTVVDAGERLEDPNAQALQRLGSTTPGEWDAADLALVTGQPAVSAGGRLPQKRAYGSDFPFRDRGQLAGVRTAPGTNADLVSAATGGFSNVWGAQVMPFAAEALGRWPVGWEQLEPHYRAVLAEVPLAAEEDDLAEHFPLLCATPHALPPLSPRSSDVLHRYEARRGELRRRGVTVGRARLAFAASSCVGCGHCMTGCPYGLIWSAGRTVERLAASGRLRHERGLLVRRLVQDGDEVRVLACEVGTGLRRELRAARVFVACGGFGSTRLALDSMASPPASLTLQEAVQFLLPLLSLGAVPDPRQDERSGFTLNQFNVLVQLNGSVADAALVHCYPYNPAVLAGLPAVLRTRSAAPLTAQLLRRLTIGLGYLPSWRSPAVRVRYRRDSDPALAVDRVGGDRPAMLGSVLRRLVRVAPQLDLWPVLPQVQVSGAAKSYHFGGGFPHGGLGPTGTDLLGRLPEWSRVHLVDGAVLPSVPATTFTLSVMANAHRIATATLGLER